MSKANIGDLVEFSRKLSKDLGNKVVKLRGIVEMVRENTVIVNQTCMENYRELDLEDRTVVNHKNYTVIG